MAADSRSEDLVPSARDVMLQSTNLQDVLLLSLGTAKTLRRLTALAVRRCGDYSLQCRHAAADHAMIIAVGEVCSAAVEPARASAGQPVRLSAHGVDPGAAADVPLGGRVPGVSQAALAAVVDVGFAGRPRTWRTAALATLAQAASVRPQTAAACRSTPEVGQEATRAPGHLTGLPDPADLPTVSDAGAAGGSW